MTWLVISEKGSRHYIPKSIATTMEEALEVHYDAFTSIAGLTRDTMIRVVAVIDTQYLKDVMIGLKERHEV